MIEEPTSTQGETVEIVIYGAAAMLVLETSVSAQSTIFCRVEELGRFTYTARASRKCKHPVRS